MPFLTQSHRDTGGMFDCTLFDNSKVIMFDHCRFWEIFLFLLNLTPNLTCPFYVLKHVAKTAHSWIVEQNQMNCQTKNCWTSHLLHPIVGEIEPMKWMVLLLSFYWLYYPIDKIFREAATVPVINFSFSKHGSTGRNSSLQRICRGFIYFFCSP